MPGTAAGLRAILDHPERPAVAFGAPVHVLGIHTSHACKSAKNVSRSRRSRGSLQQKNMLYATVSWVSYRRWPRIGFTKDQLPYVWTFLARISGMVPVGALPHSSRVASPVESAILARPAGLGKSQGQ